MLQIASLSDPVLAVYPATESLQLLRHPVDIEFAHFSNLIESIYAEIVQGPFDHRADALDEFEVIRVAFGDLAVIHDGIRCGCRHVGGVILIRLLWRIKYAAECVADCAEFGIGYAGSGIGWGIGCDTSVGVGRRFVYPRERFII